MNNYPAGVTDNDPYFTDESEIEVEEGIQENTSIVQDLDGALLNAANYFGDQWLLSYFRKWIQLQGIPWSDDGSL